MQQETPLKLGLKVWSTLLGTILLHIFFIITRVSTSKSTLFYINWWNRCMNVHRLDEEYEAAGTLNFYSWSKKIQDVYCTGVFIVSFLQGLVGIKTLTR